MQTRSRLLFVTLNLALVFTVLAGIRLASQTTQVAPADLVLRGGKIVTLDPAKPEVQALAARGGAIVAIGSAQEIAPFIGPSTEVIDLAGQLAIPGFIEGHGHFTGIGEGKLNLDLMNTKSWDEIVAMVAQAVEKAKPGEWIYGRGWHQEKWTSTPNPNVEGFPTHASLDRVSPNNPVVLTHASGHASFANAKAMELSGLTKDTRNPNGGEVLKDKDGNPTGLLRETVCEVVRAARRRASGHGASVEADGGIVVNIRQPSPAAPAEEEGTIDVLVAEDNEVNQLVFRQLLEGLGVGFTVVANGEEAVQAYKRLKPRLILMDVSMPVMNGHQAARAIRDLEKGTRDRVPIVAVTAHVLDGDRENCLASGMDDYLTKPISTDRLEEMLGRWMDLAALSAGRRSTLH